MLARSEAVLAALVDVLPVCSYVRADDAEMLAHWGDDPATTVIVVDSLGDPREFSQVAAQVSRRKPIVVFSPTGVTPAMAALTRVTGVIVVDGLRDLVDTVRLLACQPLPLGQDGLFGGRVPCSANPEQAVRALARVAAYVEWRRAAPA